MAFAPSAYRTVQLCTVEGCNGFVAPNKPWTRCYNHRQYGKVPCGRCGAVSVDAEKISRFGDHCYACNRSEALNGGARQCPSCPSGLIRGDRFNACYKCNQREREMNRIDA